MLLRLVSDQAINILEPFRFKYPPGSIILSGGYLCKTSFPIEPLGVIAALKIQQDCRHKSIQI